jgi:hypothetical protein
MWSAKIQQLESFDRKSWGTAYKAIAEVRLLLRISRKYQMITNFALHNVSKGRFCDRDGRERTIDIFQLGSYLNDQSPRTWGNKLTLFFAIHSFLAWVEGRSRESVGEEAYEAYNVMSSWGVSGDAHHVLLPAGDLRARYLISHVRILIQKHLPARFAP